MSGRDRFSLILNKLNLTHALQCVYTLAIALAIANYQLTIPMGLFVTQQTGIWQMPIGNSR